MLLIASVKAVGCVHLSMNYFLLCRISYFLIPEKDGVYWEPSIYSERDGRRDKNILSDILLPDPYQTGNPLER